MKKTKVIVGIVLLLLLLLGGIFGVINHYMNKINRENLEDVVSPENESFATEEDGEGEDDTDPNGISWGLVEPLDDEKLLNVLLVGQDRRPGQGRQRSDTMILCSVNTETKEISMISFMRDLYVQLPGDYSDNRLNAAYAFGGFPLLKDTLRLNFGVSIDGCFEVDFQGFKEIIDILGGVDIELTAEEVPYVDRQLSAGMNHLNGEQALSYSRIRYIGSDFGRTARQRRVLTAIFNRVRGSSVSQLNELANRILPYMTTDLSNIEMMGMVAQGCGILGGATLNAYRVPANDAYHSARIRGMAVLVPDLQLIRQQLETYLPVH